MQKKKSNRKTECVELTGMELGTDGLLKIDPAETWRVSIPRNRLTEEQRNILCALNTPAAKVFLAPLLVEWTTPLN